MKTQRVSLRRFLQAGCCGGLLALSILSPAGAQTRPSIAALQAQLAALEAQVANSTVPGMAGYVTMDDSNPARPTLRVTGANLQVVNHPIPGANVPGVGNVIIGHDQPRLWGGPVCSLPQYPTETDCLNGGGAWALEHKSGVHTLVVGEGHRYAGANGLVTGYRNDLFGNAGAALGGEENAALGTGAVVSGGIYNRAPGEYATVTGGYANQAAGYASSVSGGLGRWAANLYDWVAGALTQEQ